MKQYLGVDLYRTQFAVCTRLEHGRTYLRQWPLWELKLFAAQLWKDDEVAVESTGNARLFHDAVVEHVTHLAVVNPSHFKVISDSVKKTDKTMPNCSRCTWRARCQTLHPLQNFYQRIQRRRGGGKANIAFPRKFLGVIYHTLEHNWVFQDFPNFALAS